MMAEAEIQRPPSKIERLLIPESVLRNTITGLSYAAGREMLCYWLGIEAGLQMGFSASIVTTVAFPRVESAYSEFHLVEGQMGLITAWCAKHGMWLLAQVHTHPTDEPHSEADECWPASHRRGFLSVVFPFFASMSSVRTPAWRAYESEGDGVWTEILVAERFRVIPDIWVPDSASK
jgi:hypothetical protein